MDTELIPTGKDDEVDLKVKVKETNTGAIMGGIGYSTYYDVGVTASVMERNLFGRGYWLQLQGFFSWRRTSGILSFTNPRVYDTDLSVGNDLYYTHDYWDDFTKDTIGDTIRASYPIGEYTTVGGAYRLERYELYDVNPWSSPYISDYKGTNWTSALSGRILRDTTDAKDRPTKGTITRLWAEYGGGGLGGTDNFVKAVADWQGFWSFNPENTIHVRGRLGGVFQNSDDPVPVFERFWLGGMDTIRGYSYSDLSPRDYKYGGEQIGGDRMGVLNVEYVWTFQKDMGLALVPFFDAGFNIDQKTMGADLGEYLVYSAGLELRWRSPMGDLRIGLRRSSGAGLRQGNGIRQVGVQHGPILLGLAFNSVRWSGCRHSQIPAGNVGASPDCAQKPLAEQVCTREYFFCFASGFFHARLSWRRMPIVVSANPLQLGLKIGLIPAACEIRCRLYPGRWHTTCIVFPGNRKYDGAPAGIPLSKAVRQPIKSAGF